MTRRKFWWNCEYKQKNKGTVFCTKNPSADTLCLKSNCDVMDDTKGKLEKELKND